MTTRRSPLRPLLHPSLCASAALVWSMPAFTMLLNEALAFAHGYVRKRQGLGSQGDADQGEPR